MVTLPKGFVRTKFEGYFWHLVEQKLYSLKLGGVLMVLKHQMPNQFNNMRGGYQVYINGRRTRLLDDYLTNLVLEDSEIPIKLRPGLQKEKSSDQQFKNTFSSWRASGARSAVP